MISSTVLDLSLVYVQRSQAFMLLPVIQASELVAGESLLAFEQNAGGYTASAPSRENRTDAFADLLHRDGRRPLFSPAVLHTPETT